MEIVSYSTIKYLLENKYVFVITSNKVIVKLINPIINVKKICCGDTVTLVITNNTGVDLFNILICSRRRVLIERLNNNEVTIAGSFTPFTIIKYKILINNKQNTIFLKV